MRCDTSGEINGIYTIIDDVGDITSLQRLLLREQGKGYGVDIIRHVISTATTSVIITPLPTNQRMIGLLEFLGFVYEGKTHKGYARYAYHIPNKELLMEEG